MRVLFIMDPIESLQKRIDSTLPLMRETQKRGHEVWYCTVDELGSAHEKPRARMHWLRVRGTEWEILKTEECLLQRARVIFMRKDPPFTIDYFLATSLLMLVDKTKTFIINRPQGILLANEKLYALQFPSYAAQTFISKKHSLIKKFIQKHGQAVLKPLTCSSGHGVFHICHGDRNLNPLLEVMTNHQQRFVLVQEYIPTIKTKGDKRIVMLNGEPIAAATRIPVAEDHRGNIHSGARTVKAKITQSEQKMCTEIGTQLQRDGIYLAGLDFIGEKLTEINVTSVGLLQTMNELYNIKIEEKVLDFVEQMIKKPSTKSAHV